MTAIWKSRIDGINKILREIWNAPELELNNDEFKNFSQSIYVILTKNPSKKGSTKCDIISYLIGTEVYTFNRWYKKDGLINRLDILEQTAVKILELLND